jgi:hypothetical protein
MSKYLPTVVVVIVIFGAALGVPRYLEKYALCAVVDEVKQDVKKTAQQSEEPWRS